MEGLKMNRPNQTNQNYRDYAFWLVGLLVIALAAFALFGLAGFRTILAIAVLFVISPLLFLKNASLEIEEKIFFSLFIGIGLFPLLAWLVNQVLPSFRVSVIAALAIAVSAGLFSSRILGRLHKKAQ